MKIKRISCRTNSLQYDFWWQSASNNKVSQYMLSSRQASRQAQKWKDYIKLFSICFHLTLFCVIVDVAVVVDIIEGNLLLSWRLPFEWQHICRMKWNRHTLAHARIQNLEKLLCAVSCEICLTISVSASRSMRLWQMKIRMCCSRNESFPYACIRSYSFIHSVHWLTRPPIQRSLAAMTLFVL